MHTFAKITAATCFLAICTPAIAAEDPIATRQALMKNVGAAMKVAGAMMKGQMEYDAAAAELAMRTINSSALGFPAFFPDNSKTGGDTEAAPAIWEDMAGFNKISAQFAADTAAAADAAKGGMDSFKGAFGKMAGNCKACHEKYRVKKN
ncbi:MAG: c-type cytochrome [Hyphomicrobiales bacterium]